jgi:hypothetical protein
VSDGAEWLSDTREVPVDERLRYLHAVGRLDFLPLRLGERVYYRWFVDVGEEFRLRLGRA